MIKFENVTKKYDDFTALENFELEIPTGCAYGLLGTNGAGKSTLLRILSGVYRADTGKVTIDGEEVYDNAAVKQRLLLISDETSQFNGMTLLQMKKFYKTFYSNFSDETFERLNNVVQLPLNKKLGGFSKGMKRQAAMICGISAKTDYLFLDEAFDGLDPSMRAEIKKMIIDAMCDNDMTVVTSSHNLQEIEEFCDTVGLLHKGKMLFNKDLGELKGDIHKVQCSFGKQPEKEDFPELDILVIKEVGGITNIIARGSADETISKIKAKSPEFCDLIPLSLEEIFIYEMEAQNYDRTELM